MTTRLAAVMTVTLALASWGCHDDRGDHIVVGEPTALDQSNEPSDLALVGQVRRKLVLDQRLSLRAKNVMVIVRGGVVTLRGDVAGAFDHDALVARVASVPGIVSIDDRIAYR